MIFRRKAKDIVERQAAEDETTCLFVGSKGIMKLCEVHQPLPNDRANRWPIAPLSKHTAGGRIYVHATAMKHFAKRALPRITEPFVLVSGDSVLDVNADGLGRKVFDKVLSDPHLIRWHTQNIGALHPKLHSIPLGLDYHTIASGARPDWGPSASPRAQEDMLHTLRAMGRPLADRVSLGYSNWHFMLGNGDRAEVIEALPSDASFFETEITQRTESWRRNADYFFTISPRGRGMDCHRTWEAILLGSVPIIPDLPINDLFKSLPVVIVQDWSQVTPTFLAEQKKRILSETFDFAPVLLETWRRRINGRADVPELRMTYQQFMTLGPTDLTF